MTNANFENAYEQMNDDFELFAKNHPDYLENKELMLHLVKECAKNNKALDWYYFRDFKIEFPKDKDFLLNFLDASGDWAQWNIWQIKNFDYKGIQDDFSYLKQLCKYTSIGIANSADYFNLNLIGLHGKDRCKELLVEFYQNNKCTFNMFRDFNDDKDLALIAIKAHGDNVNFLSDRLQDDRDIVLEAVKNGGPICPKNGSYRFIYDRECLIEYYKNSNLDGGRDLHLGELNHSLKTDLELMRIIAPKIQSDYFAYLHCDILNNKEFAVDVVSSNPRFIEYLGKDVKDDLDVVKIVVSKCPKFLEYCSVRFQHSEFAESVFNLEFASKEMKNDKEYVKKCMSPSFDMYASDFALAGNQVKKDLLFINELYDVGFKSIYEYADKSIRDLKNGGNIEKIINHEKIQISLLKKFENDFDYVKNAVSGNGLLLEYVSDRFKNDPQICASAIQSNAFSAKYFGEKLKSCIKSNVGATVNALNRVEKPVYVDVKIQQSPEPLKRKMKI